MGVVADFGGWLRVAQAMGVSTATLDGSFLRRTSRSNVTVRAHAHEVSY
jgi:hypothetical protein